MSVLTTLAMLAPLLAVEFTSAHINILEVGNRKYLGKVILKSLILIIFNLITESGHWTFACNTEPSSCLGQRQRVFNIVSLGISTGLQKECRPG